MFKKYDNIKAIKHLRRTQKNTKIWFVVHKSYLLLYRLNTLCSRFCIKISCRNKACLALLKNCYLPAEWPLISLQSDNWGLLHGQNAQQNVWKHSDFSVWSVCSWTFYITSNVECPKSVGCTCYSGWHITTITSLQKIHTMAQSHQVSNL